MGLLELLGGGDKVKKWQTRLVQRYGPPENRAKAIEELAKMDTPQAYGALLTRFDVLAEASIPDKEEKERIYTILIEAGEKAVAPIKSFLMQGQSASWPLKALVTLAPREEYVGTILAALDKIGAGYARDPSKKLDLVKHLALEKDPRIIPALVPYLEDTDDAVKIATAEAIAAQGDPASRDALIQFLLGHTDNRRVLAAAASALVQTGFDVKGHTPAVEKALPPGYGLNREGKVVKR